MSEKTVIGLDVGGTKIHAGLISPDGTVIKTATLPTDTKKGRSAILRNIASAARQVWDGSPSAIGVGMAGLINPESGTYVQGPNFPKSFKNIAIGSALSDEFKVPVSIDNDAHCFALAEAVCGAGKGKRLVVGITLGTGVGGGIVMDRKIMRGAHNAAGEVGHMTIGWQHSAICGCGMSGHFEALASGNAMAKIYRQLTDKDVKPIDVENMAKSGDKTAMKIIETMAESLAAGLASLIHAFDPDIIVVGGGLAKVDILWKPALELTRNKLIYPVLQKTPIVRATLGPNTGIVGAALLTENYLS